MTTAFRVRKALQERLKHAWEEWQVASGLAVKALEDYLDRQIPVDDLELER